MAAGVLDSAMVVHRALAPRTISHAARQLVSVTCRGELIRAGRVDLVVERCVLAELKSVTRLEPVHVSQVVACLRAAD